MVFRSFFQGVTHKSIKRIFLLSSILAYSTLIASAQNWEVVREIDFEGQIGSLNITDFQSNNFFGITEGATGQSDDECAYSATGAIAYIAMLEQLEAGINYRLTVNAKAQIMGNTIGFAYGNTPGLINIIQQGTGVAQLASSAPGEDIASSVFTVDTDGAYYLTIQRGISAGWIRLDNFTLERETPPLLPDFTLTQEGSSEPIADVIILDYGETVNLCLTPDAAPTSEVVIDIIPAEGGDGAPHYPGFSEALTFPANEANALCFALEQATEIDTDANYVFEVKAGDEILQTFEVLVFNCEQFAGPDRELCEGQSVQLGTGCLPEPHPEEGVNYCYLWEPAEGLDDPTSARPNLVASEDISYFVYITTSEGEFIGQDDVNIIVNYPELEVSATNTIICEGNDTELSVENSDDWESFKWYFNDVEIQGVTTATITVSEGGLYTAEGKASNGCTARGTFTVGSTADLESLADAFEEEGFICIDVTVGEPGLAPGRNSCNTYVEDKTDGLSFSFSGSGNVINNLSCLLDGFLADANVCGDNLSGLITMNDNICEEGSFFETNNAGFDGADAGYWIHFLDRPGDDDCMVIRVNTQEGIETQVENFGLYLEGLLETVWSDNDLYGYASKDEQIIGIMFNETLNTYVDTVPIFIPPLDNNYSDLVLPIQETPYIPIGPCTNNNAVIGVSPSGMPIWVESGARVGFGVTAKYKDKIDGDALTSFTLNDPNGYKGRFRAGVKKGCEEFVGYINQLKPTQKYQFNPDFLGDSPAKVVWGRLRPLRCPLTHIEVRYSNYNFDPTEADPFAIGDGDLVPSLDLLPYPYTPGEPIGYSSMLCQAGISQASLHQPLAVNLNPHIHPPGQGNGWIITVKNDLNGIDYIYCYLNNDGTTYTYLRYNCLGEWVSWEPPGHEEMYNFLNALISAIPEILSDYETIAAILHGGLDVIGITVPLAGGVADGINSVWYFAEGNYTEAAISTAAIFVDAAILVKYVPAGIILKDGDEIVHDVFSVIKVVFTNSPASYRVISGITQIKRMKNLGFTADESTRCWYWMHNIIKSSSLDGHTEIVVKSLVNSRVYRTWLKADRAGFDDFEMLALFQSIVKNDIIDDLASAAYTSNADEMMEFFLNNTNGLSAWKVLNSANSSLIDDLSALEKVAFLKSKGFSDQSLNLLAIEDDIKVLIFAEGFSIRGISEVEVMAKHVKMMAIKLSSTPDEFLKYQDEINNIITARHSMSDEYLLSNPDGLLLKISGMNTSGSNNPFLVGGHDFEVEWANRLVLDNKTIRIDAPQLPDVLDDIELAAYQCKKVTGEGANAVGKNAKNAVKQIKPTGQEPSPPGYSKNVVIKVANSMHIHYNASKQDLINYLQGYNLNGGNPVNPTPGTLNGMDYFIILNNQGEHYIEGALIDL